MSENLRNSYISERNNAQEALLVLQKHRDEINSKLELEPSNPYLNKDLRTVDLEIKITLNEIENAEDYIRELTPNDNSVLK